MSGGYLHCCLGRGWRGQLQLFQWYTNWNLVNKRSDYELELITAGHKQVYQQVIYWFWVCIGSIVCHRKSVGRAWSAL